MSRVTLISRDGCHLCEVAELQVFCAAHLARFKQPSRIQMVAELPHSAIGKVRKRELEV